VSDLAIGSAVTLVGVVIWFFVRRGFVAPAPDDTNVPARAPWL
jgi:hypothetical protein